MKKTSRFSILVFLFLFIMAVHGHEGTKSGKRPSKTEIQETKGDHPRRLVHGDYQRKDKGPKTAKSIISRPKPVPAQRMPPKDNLKPKHVARLERKKNTANQSLICTILEFINSLFRINFISDVLCPSNNQSSTTITSTSSGPAVQTTTTQQTTLQTTTQPSTLPILSFSDNVAVYLTCQHLSGSRIKLIEATFGAAADSSCPPTNVAPIMSNSNGKTSFMLRASGYYFGGLCENYNGATFLQGTYTCSPISNTAGSSMVMDAFEGTQLVISCPAGTIVMDSATYGSFDELFCPPTSVMGYPALGSANSGLTSFSLYVSSSTTFDNLCSARSANNHLVVTYRCQTTSVSTFNSTALPVGSLNMVCPRGSVSVTSLIFRSQSNSSCYIDTTNAVRSIIPSNTAEVYLSNFNNTLASCNNAQIVINANYSCVSTTVSPQFTVLVQDLTYVILKCPAGQTINLVTSNYFCATNPAVPSYSNPAAFVNKCNGKKEICYFFVAKWSVLNVPFDPNNVFVPPDSAFPNCRDGSGGQIVMLSATYTCTV